MESFIFMDKQNWDYNLVYETEFNPKSQKGFLALRCGPSWLRREEFG